MGILCWLFGTLAVFLEAILGNIFEVDKLPCGDRKNPVIGAVDMVNDIDMNMRKFMNTPDAECTVSRG
jgi:hypothetical protein